MSNLATEIKTRTPSMKWIKLGTGKEPDFDKPLFLTDGEDFYCGILTKIEQESQGKKYSFDCGVSGIGEDIILDSLSHYCLPVLPNN